MTLNNAAPDIAPPSSHGKSGLNTIVMLVYILYTLVTTVGAGYGLLKPSATEFEQARQLNASLQNRVNQLERDAPVREKQLRDDLAMIHSQLLGAQASVSELTDRLRSSESQLTEERQRSLQRAASVEGAEQHIRELKALLSQDRPTIIGTVD